MGKQNDAMVVLEEVALSLKESAEHVNVNSSFEEGRLVGYYEALSTLISQSNIAGIGLDDIGLADFNVESLLSKTQKAA